jgi:hypothetical protein
MPASFLPIPYHQVKYSVAPCPSCAPSRPSASPSPSPSPSEFPTIPIPILILPLFHSQIRLRVKMPLKNWSRHPGRTMCVETFLFIVSPEPTPIPFPFPPTLSLTHALLRTQPGYMHTLASELTNEASPVFVRNAAGLALKNALTARVRRAVPPSLPHPPRPHPSLTFLPGSYRTARVRLSTRPAGLASMSRSAARSKSLSCVVFTLSRSRPAQLLRRASQLSPPWNSRRANGQI